MPSFQAAVRGSFRVLAVVAFLFSASAFAQTIVWDNALGGAWETPTNWLPPRVPVAGDDVAITLAGDYTVTLTSSSPALASKERLYLYDSEALAIFKR